MADVNSVFMTGVICKDATCKPDGPKNQRMEFTLLNRSGWGPTKQVMRVRCYQRGRIFKLAQICTAGRAVHVQGRLEPDAEEVLVRIENVYLLDEGQDIEEVHNGM